MSEDAHTLESIRARIEGLTEREAKRVVCALVGHSRIQIPDFRYFYCARCEAYVGDNVGSSYDLMEVVIVDHDCPTCRANYETLTWHDTFLTPDPFDAAVPAESA